MTPPTPPDENSLYNRPRKGLARRFFKYMKPYKVPLRNVYLLYFLNSMLNLLPAWSLRYLYDMVIVPKPVSLFGFAVDTTGVIDTPSEKVTWTLVYFFGLTLIIVGANAIGVVMWRLGTRVTQRLLLDLKTHIIHHLHKLSLSYFHREQTGSIISRAVGDVMQMQQMIKTTFGLAYGLMHLILAPILMLLMSPLLLAFCLIPLPVIVHASRRIRYQLRPLYRQQRHQQAKVSAAVQEQVSGIREIKAFGQEASAAEDVARVNREYLQTVNDTMRIFSLNHQMLYGSKDLAMILAGSAGGILIATGTGNVTAGMVLSFLPLMTLLFQPINQLMAAYDTIQRGLASTERVFEFLDVEPDITNAPQAQYLPLEQGRVTFEDVSFAYQPDGPLVLEQIDLDVAAGQHVAIVGSTGSGKSTLVSLVPRFYDPTAGTVRIDGHRLEDLKMEALRDAIGIVFQETFLFFGTIEQNIAFSRPEATREEIIEAAVKANIHDFIEQLPDGYDTHVGERGVTLSGGQRQRLAIARMILKDPRIIILDEATSALDNKTERLLQESMEHLIEGRTAFVIAHRLSTVRKADLIIVLEQGRVVESGSHDELLAAGGHYKALLQAGW
ncbi:MAG: ABC transporter ATP-binding protein [Phycisphaerae bacterium]